MRTFQVYFLILIPISINLSLVMPGYEAGISSLVEVTRVVLQEKLKGVTWVMCTIAFARCVRVPQLPLALKIDACAA
jgi:hypothetical protein